MTNLELLPSIPRRGGSDRLAAHLAIGKKRDEVAHLMIQSRQIFDHRDGAVDKVTMRLQQFTSLGGQSE